MRRSTLVFAALLALGCSRKKEQASLVQVVPVERRDIIVDAEATGTVEPINVVEVKSKASGQIVRMPVETGAIVKPGDLLVQVDTRDVRNQFDQTLANVRASQERLKVATAQKRRADEMFEKRVITAQEHETATLDFANAQAALVSARTNLDLAKQRLEDATVTAPVAGTVIEKSVSLGQVITSATGAFGGGTTLLKMADLARVRVRALVNETDIGQLRPGQVATVVVDAYPDRPFQGVVEKIEPQAVVQQSVTMFPVLVTLDNREGMLKPGMNGEVNVVVNRRPGVLAVPSDAVRSPREAQTAAQILGLNADSVAAQIRTQMAATRGPGAPGDEPATVTVPAGAAPAGVTTRQARGDVALQQNGQHGGAGARGPGGRQARQGGGAMPSGMGGANDANGAGVGDGNGARGRTRPGLVFVAQGKSYTPRVVRLGANDYDYVEVVSGLREGEAVALLAAATLQFTREQQQERFRNMTSGGMQRQQGTQGGATGTGAAGGGAGPVGGGRRGGMVP